jgi:hypothetical protein
MENLNVQNLGAAAGAVTVIYLMFQNAPKVIEAFKPQVIVDTQDENTEIMSALVNNTSAITQLTHFLQTQAAVSEVKDVQATAMLTAIDKKLDIVILQVSEHATKCDITCRK